MASNDNGNDYPPTVVYVPAGNGTFIECRPIMIAGTDYEDAT
jgi:hypothetical protein